MCVCDFETIHTCRGRRHTAIRTDCEWPVDGAYRRHRPRNVAQTAHTADADAVADAVDADAVDCGGGCGGVGDGVVKIGDGGGGGGRPSSVASRGASARSHSDPSRLPAPIFSRVRAGDRKRHTRKKASGLVVGRCFGLGIGGRGWRFEGVAVCLRAWQIWYGICNTHTSSTRSTHMTNTNGREI